MNELLKQIQSAKDRARAFKSKSAQTKAWNKVYAFEHEAFDLLYAACDKYALYSIRGTVQHFHDGEQNVFVKLDDGTTIWICPTNDVVSKSWYANTCCVSYKSGQNIIVEFEVNVDNDRLCLYQIPKRVYGGTLNEIKFRELDRRTDLAFFKHSTGGQSELFA